MEDEEPALADESSEDTDSPLASHDTAEATSTLPAQLSHSGPVPSRGQDDVSSAGSQSESTGLAKPALAQSAPETLPERQTGPTQTQQDEAIATSSLEQMREAEEKIVAAPLAAGPESSNGSKKQKKDKKKDKKRKDKKDKKSKKEKNNKPDCSEEMQSREVKRQATPQVAIVAAQLDSSSSSSTSDIGQITEAASADVPPSEDDKLHTRSAVLQGRCHRGHSGPAANSQSELREPGEAAAEYRRQARRHAVREPEGERLSHRDAWQARATRMGPSPPVAMGIPHIIDPLMMSHPGIMTVPLMLPEMIQGPHYHPMAMMVDPALMMSNFQEKPDKAKKERKKDRDREKEKPKADKASATAATTATRSKEKRHPKHEKIGKQKGSEKLGAQEAPQRKERKVDEEDL